MNPERDPNYKRELRVEAAKLYIEFRSLEQVGEIMGIVHQRVGVLLDDPVAKAMLAKAGVKRRRRGRPRNRKVK